MGGKKQLWRSECDYQNTVVITWSPENSIVLKSIKQRGYECFHRESALCGFIFATTWNSESGSKQRKCRMDLYLVIHSWKFTDTRGTHSVAKEHLSFAQTSCVFPSPESRVSPQPPEWAPGGRSYALPFFPGPERSTGAGPSQSSATRPPGTESGGRLDLHTEEQC